MNGAAGLTFGMDQPTVIGILLEKGAAIYENKSDIITLTNVSGEIKTADLIHCSFLHDKLYEIPAIFIPESQIKTKDLYNEIKNILDKRYGDPDTIIVVLNFSDTEKSNLTFKKVGLTEDMVGWFNFKNDKIIELEIRGFKFMYVSLRFADSRLSHEAFEEYGKRGIRDAYEINQSKRYERLLKATFKKSKVN